MHKNLPPELSFLTVYRAASNDFERADWRLGPFEANFWPCWLEGVGNFEIDFKKRLANGSSLVSPKNAKLLQNIKRLLCFQTHPALTGGAALANKTIRLRISYCIQVIDYFLLRDKHFNLGANGFNTVTADEISNLIDDISHSSSIKSLIYRPVEEIESFLKEVRISDDELNKLIKTHPTLFTPDTGTNLQLSSLELIRARAWLKRNHCYYTNDSTKKSSFAYFVRRAKLLEIIIGNRVLGNLKFDGLELDGLDVGEYGSFLLERNAVPVSNHDEDNRAHEFHLDGYIYALNSMRVAGIHGNDLIRETEFRAIDKKRLITSDRTKKSLRFTTLPFELANTILKDSIAFFLEYGQALVDYYLAVAQFRRFPQPLPLAVPSQLKKLGVVSWSIQSNSKEDFFIRFRKGEGLFEMLQVLYGAIAIITNSLMARRASEISELAKKDIIKDGNEYYLGINQRKENLGELRNRRMKPMPKISAEALLLLSQLHDSLSQMGFTVSQFLFGSLISPYFKRPPWFGSQGVSLRSCLNRFCDYTETMLDDQGRRYYVRFHQLRRNFALLFFWRGTFGGLEVLRHFLGHSSLVMTYRYVTEALSGKVLLRVKATVAKDFVKSGKMAAEELASLVCERYGLELKDLAILKESVLVNYIEELLKQGDATVEPEFFRGPFGEDYKIVYRVIHKQPTP